MIALINNYSVHGKTRGTFRTPLLFLVLFMKNITVCDKVLSMTMCSTDMEINIAEAAWNLYIPK